MPVDTLCVEKPKGFESRGAYSQSMYSMASAPVKCFIPVTLWAAGVVKA
jgi:hypothetical protein